MNQRKKKKEAERVWKLGGSVIHWEPTEDKDVGKSLKDGMLFES